MRLRLGPVDIFYWALRVLRCLRTRRSESYMSRDWRHEEPTDLPDWWKT